jgi:anti-sigma factor RsiW
MSDCTVSAQRLDDYADGRCSAGEAAVLEVHVLRCELCQTWLAPRAQALRLDRIWERVEQRLGSADYG